MPLPPSSSRAHATVSRHLAVVKALARDACASVILPSACNWDMRTKRHCEAVMLASILARRSCTIWNELIGLQAVFLRNAAVLQCDQAVLHDLEGDFVQDFFDLEAGCGLVLDDKRLDLVVGEIARPDDRDVAPRRIADPFLLAVENPCIPVTLGRSCKAASGSRADERFGQSEAANFFPARHWREPFVLLFL